MTVPIWPTELPRPMRDGYQRQLPSGAISTRRDAGPPFVRRRFSSAVSAVTMTIDVSADPRARFWRFWEEEVAHGTIPFFAPDSSLTDWPVSDAGGGTLTTDAGDAIGIESWWLVVAGESAPTEAPAGNRWRITMQLTVLP